jgi:thiazole synthase ThiGH ThiG subunit
VGEGELVSEEDDLKKLGLSDPEELMACLKYLIDEGFITLYYDADGDPCVRLSEVALRMDEDELEPPQVW